MENYKKGEIIYVKYRDHFNVQDFVHENLHQEQCGFFDREEGAYLYISLSKHTYDDGANDSLEELVGILKAEIVEMHKLLFVARELRRKRCVQCNSDIDEEPWTASGLCEACLRLPGVPDKAHGKAWERCLKHDIMLREDDNGDSFCPRCDSES
jgi:hypothetical protein